MKDSHKITPATAELKNIKIGVTFIKIGNIFYI